MWKIEGGTLDSDPKDMGGRVTIEWLPGGFFMVQRGETASNEFKVHGLETIGYDPSAKAFTSYAYSDVAGSPSRYYWDVRGDVAKHWTEGARCSGRFGEGGDAISGGWRPIGAPKEDAGERPRCGHHVVRRLVSGRMASE